jgi:hypothetical protein
VPRLERYTLAYLPEGPVIDWTGDIDAWLDPLAAYLKARGAFAIRLGPPVRTDGWSADQVKEGIADPGTRRLTDVPAHWTDPVGARVAGRLSAYAPHLNPDELVNADLKRTLADQVITDRAQMERSVRAFFHRVQKLPAHVLGYFQASHTKYASSIL